MKWKIVEFPMIEETVWWLDYTLTTLTSLTSPNHHLPPPKRLLWMILVVETKVFSQRIFP